MTGKTVISMYPEESEYVVVDQAWRRSDKRDGKDYSLEIDTSSLFFPQFSKLRKLVPHKAQAVLHSENSDYINY